MTIKFSMRAVPRRVRGSVTLAEMVEEYTKKLQDENWKWGLCVHEAAHAIFSERFGYRMAQFNPTLDFEYDADTDEFIIHQAHVLVDIEDDWREELVVALAGPVVVPS